MPKEDYPKKDNYGKDASTDNNIETPSEPVNATGESSLRMVVDQSTSADLSFDSAEDEKLIEKFHDEYNEATNDEGDLDGIIVDGVETFFTSDRIPRDLMDEFEMSEFEENQSNDIETEYKKTEDVVQEGLFIINWSYLLSLNKF